MASNNGYRDSVLPSGVTPENDWVYVQGIQAPAGAVDPRQHRPLAHHAHQRCDRRGTATRSCCGLTSRPRWIAAPSGST